MKTLTIDLNITLPGGEVVTLAKHTIALTVLEAEVLGVIANQNNGKIEVIAEAEITEA